MLTTFIRSLIPMVEAVAVALPKVRAEAEAFAAALRRHVGDAVSVGPGPVIDPGVGPGPIDPG